LPLFVYRCSLNECHVAWERNNLGQVTSCTQCGGPSVRLRSGYARKLGLARFIDLSPYRLSS
jgi:hypothetical protein